MSISKAVPHIEEWFCSYEYATYSLQCAALIHSKDTGWRFAVLHGFIHNMFLLICYLLKVCHWMTYSKKKKEKKMAAATPPDRRHHDNCTVVLTKALSGLQCADKKLIVLLLFWHLRSHFCTTMKTDGSPFPFEFTENEVPVTNYCRLYIMTILFSLCSLKSLFITAPRRKTYKIHPATVDLNYKDKFHVDR